MTVESTPNVSLSDRLTHLVNQAPFSAKTLVLAAALIIGGVTGSAMVLFRLGLDAIHDLLFERGMGLVGPWGSWTLALVPILGGALVGLLRWAIADPLGQGWLALLQDARTQIISPWRPVYKLLAAALSLGTGASLGPEGPSVDLGANVGILLGQAFQVSRTRYRQLLGAGAAAGLAAGFNAPIAGVFFAVEVVLGLTFTSSTATMILLSAVVSSLIARSFLGVHPAFILPTYRIVNSWEWIFYLGLGVLASLVSIAFNQAIRWSHKLFAGEIPSFAGFKDIPTPVKPVLGGLAVGILALVVPQVLGVGYETLGVILVGAKFQLPTLIALLVLKLIATALCLGSGLVGGIFAPAMFLGGCLGAMYGLVLNSFTPEGVAPLLGPPAAYAMVGMAAVLAGTARAPLTSILLLFELTRDYLIILPLMAAVGVTVWLEELLHSLPSVGMGVGLAPEDESQWLEQMAIAQLLSQDYLAVEATMPLLEAGSKMLRSQQYTALVLSADRQLVGVLTLADIRRRLQPGAASLEAISVGEVCITDVVVATPQESVAKVQERMSLRGLQLLPVVDPADAHQVIGVVAQHQIAIAADIAATEALLK
jgi:H+/Cl- antiporter ClcA/CBS domain-containing protein